MKIIPSKAQWNKWTLPSKASYVALCVSLLGIILYFVLPSIKVTQHFEGDNVKGDKVTNYITFIQKESDKTNKTNIVTEVVIKSFFRRLQLAITNKKSTLSNAEILKLPKYLQRPYDINVTVSKTHGLGYKFITPSDNAEINISITSMPIEQYYFSKYTSEENILNSSLFTVGVKYLVISNYPLLGGKKVVAVTHESSVLLRNARYRYSKSDSYQKIEFLRIFGNNQLDYWNNMDPKDEATHLFSVK